MNVIEPAEILLDKPRKVLVNHAALFKAETEVNRIRGNTAFNRLGIDYLIVNAFNALIMLKAPFPLDLLAVMLWASIVREESRDAKGRVQREEIKFEDIFPILDDSQTATNDIAVALFEAYCKTAGKNIKRGEAAKDDDGEAEKKNHSQSTGLNSGASPASN